MCCVEGELNVEWWSVNLGIKVVVESWCSGVDWGGIRGVGGCSLEVVRCVISGGVV